jgi:hypothetical protein
VGNGIDFAGASCYAGDYVAATADTPNASVFFSWGQNTPTWTVQAAVRSQ